MDALDAAAAGHVEHVAHAEQLFTALLAQDRAAVDLGCHLERDAGREVGLDRAGDDVDRGALCGHDDVDAGGARHLGEPLDRAFDVLAGNHHEVGHFVDDDDDIGDRLEIEFLGFVDRLAGLAVEAGLHRAGQDLALGDRLFDAAVEAVDVAHADLRHLLVALFHLAHRPFQRHDGLLRVGDHRREQMRNAVIDRQFEHFRVDHDQPAFFRREPVDQRQDEGVDGDRFTGAGGTGDQKVGHLGEVDHHRLAADGLTERDGELGLVAIEVLAADQFAQIDGLAPLVRQFDADGVAAGNDGDAGGDRAHRTGDVVGQADDARRLDAGCRFQFVEGDDRAGADLDDLALDAEILQHAFEHAGILLERVGRQRGVAGDGLRLCQ